MERSRSLTCMCRSWWKRCSGFANTRAMRSTGSTSGQPMNAPRSKRLPKPMVKVGGKPLLEHQVLLARKHGIRDILMLTGYGAEHIERYFGDGAKWDVRVRYQRELKPLGTAGALLDAFDELDDTFVVMYGDTMVNVDLRRMIAAHSPGASATLLVHPNDHPQDSDLVEMNDRSEIVAFHSYPHPANASLQNLVNAALYVFS